MNKLAEFKKDVLERYEKVWKMIKELAPNIEYFLEKPNISIQFIWHSTNLARELVGYFHKWKTKQKL